MFQTEFYSKNKFLKLMHLVGFIIRTVQPSLTVTEVYKPFIYIYINKWFVNIYIPYI